MKNRELFERLIELLKIHSVEFSWVKGHDGHEENERCDFEVIDLNTGCGAWQDTRQK